MAERPGRSHAPATVHMPVALYEALKAEAKARGQSLSSYLLDRLTAPNQEVGRLQERNRMLEHELGTARRLNEEKHALLMHYSHVMALQGVKA